MQYAPPVPIRKPLAILIALLGAVTTASAAETVELAPVEVVGTTPLPGINLPKDQVPANVQLMNSRQLRDAGGPSLAENLQRKMPSVNVNEVQGNPYQADLNYRGFSASPLLGTPQGLSVFLDGVRVNEPFGDVVNWDLIPQTAIATMTLVPGSNPLYGLNTLGGALALQTKRGDTHPGGALEVYGGAFNRRGGSIEHGGKRGELSWYVAAEGMKEDGWRDRSPSEVGQLFGKLAWTRGETDVALTLAHADTDLIGNALVPESILRQRREAIFTHPDQTRNRSSLLALSGSHWLNDQDQISGTVYARRTLTRTLNGDLNDEFGDEFAEWAAAGFPAGAEPESGALNRTRTGQTAAGIALQWSRIAGAHQFSVGVSHDRSHANFRQSEQAGELTANRGISATGDEEQVNSLLGRTRTTSLYATDTVALAPTLHLTGSLRYNRTRVINSDRMGDALNGDFTYHKLNPALGLTWQATPALTVYGGFTQGNRAPTPIELGCADPENACSLPNAMAADPFLRQVVTRTVELGVRGKLAGNTQWNATAFRSTNRDDILFVGTGGSLGFFTNFGQTRRQGVELGLSGEIGAFDWQANYSYLDATFQSSACLLAENNSTEGQGGCPDDEIRVARGDRLPGLPKHSLKLGVDWHATEVLRVGADLIAYSGRYVRGNENNRHEPEDGFEGRGKLPGYGVVNLRADYQLARGWTLFGRIDNLFDKRYATAGALAENPFVGPDNAFVVDPGEWRHEQFVAPGAPRSAWVGVRYAWKGI
ncbi:TonB-dependent receptor [Aromatoleum toluvorans]|uniref:TonB-dependent receptor n=1 Tax=Aromatoleum toluvorans TaxID=92002 RepID=A0ABX1Q094_9RHOO|nr:TonB-dependent receptor [Aromatoleum toluvorans]NMG45109.1 TonB-dependent receptor [Aromatoleum toluvorans]